MAANDLRAERLSKLQLLKERGIDPYPAESNRTHDNAAFLANFEALHLSQETVALGGRIMSLRKQGGIVFADLVDGTGRVQVVMDKEGTDPQLFDLFDNAVSVSDFVEFSGQALTTKRGIRSLKATTWTMLAKSIRQVPDEWFGLKDEDERYRKRYLDFILNPESADLVRKRSMFWNAIRSFMLSRNYVEVETPILETKTGGAEARPFITHHNALDLQVFLRISHELWHKKLIIAGFPRVFEIGRVFRNEGMSYEHAQDYTHFEFYEAYLDAREGVPMLIDLYRHAAKEAFGTLQFSIHGFDVDLGAEWTHLDFNKLMLERYDFDPRTVSLQSVQNILNEKGIPFEPTADLGRCIDLLWKLVRKTIGGPAILTGIPVFLEPLAKRNKDDRTVVDRFQIIIGGSELGKAFNELNDPQDQLERFEQQQALRDAGDEEAQMADFEYVEAMEYGMPPTFGFGVSERLFSFLAGKSIRETQIFPLMRPRPNE